MKGDKTLMAITRWNPMSEMVSLHDAMDRLLAESFVRPWQSLAQTIESTMPVDMYEENDQLVVKTSMPGVKPEDVNIEVRDDVLTITGEIKSEESKPGDGGQPQAMMGQAKQPGQAQGQQKQGDGQNWYMRERQYARFVRSVALPYPVQTDKAEATLENGVLTLRLPKAEQAKQKKIPVKTK